MIHIIAILVFLIGMPTSLLFRVDLNKGKEDLFEWIINLASWFQNNMEPQHYVLSLVAIYILLAIICYIKLVNNYIKDDGDKVSTTTVLKKLYDLGYSSWIPHVFSITLFLIGGMNIPRLLISPFSLLFYKKKDNKKKDNKKKDNKKKDNKKPCKCSC